MAKQLQVPGTERKVNKAVATAAEAYVSERDKRMKLTEKEKASKDALIAVMRKEGLQVYRADDAEPPVIITLTSKDNVKVTEVGDDDEGGDGGELQ